MTERAAEPSPEALAIIADIVTVCGPSGHCYGPPCACASALDAFRREGVEKAAPGGMWRPISEFSKDDAAEFDFWLEWADGVGGDVPLGQSAWAYDQRFHGYYQGWRSLYKATHFMPLPAPPSTTSSETSDD